MITLDPLLLHEVSARSVDLRERSSALAKDRKVLRLVDDRARANFVCVLEAAAHIADTPPEEVALYTVSEYVYEPPAPVGHDTSPSEDELARRAFKDNADPSGWLRGMPNSGICMASISGGFQGPNLHLVGGGRAVGLAASLACVALQEGAATVAVISAYSATADGDGDARAVVVRASTAASLPNPLEWDALAALNAYDGLGLVHDELRRRQTEAH